MYYQKGKGPACKVYELKNFINWFQSDVSNPSIIVIGLVLTLMKKKYLILNIFIFISNMCGSYCVICQKHYTYFPFVRNPLVDNERKI